MRPTKEQLVRLTARSIDDRRKGVRLVDEKGTQKVGFEKRWEGGKDE